jgi:hypothetical protein
MNYDKMGGAKFTERIPFCHSSCNLLLLALNKNAEYAPALRAEKGLASLANFDFFLALWSGYVVCLQG